MLWNYWEIVSLYLMVTHCAFCMDWVKEVFTSWRGPCHLNIFTQTKTLPFLYRKTRSRKKTKWCCQLRNWDSCQTTKEGRGTETLGVCVSILFRQPFGWKLCCQYFVFLGWKATWGNYLRNGRKNEVQVSFFSTFPDGNRLFKSLSTLCMQLCCCFLVFPLI